MTEFQKYKKQRSNLRINEERISTAPTHTRDNDWSMKYEITTQRINKYYNKCDLVIYPQGAVLLILLTMLLLYQKEQYHVEKQENCWINNRRKQNVYFQVELFWIFFNGQRLKIHKKSIHGNNEDNDFVMNSMDKISKYFSH